MLKWTFLFPKSELENINTPSSIHLSSDIYQNAYSLIQPHFNMPNFLNGKKTSSLKVQSSKATYESKLIHSFAGKCNSNIYDYINKLSKNNSIPPTVSLNSLYASTDHERATHFNTFFHSVFLHSPFLLPPLSPCLPSTLVTSTYLSWKYLKPSLPWTQLSLQALMILALYSWSIVPWLFMFHCTTCFVSLLLNILYHLNGNVTLLLLFTNLVIEPK